MGRIHLFEFEDQSWFPSFIRDYMTDFLQFLSNLAKIYKPVSGLLAEKILASGQHQIIDLASGGGGGLLWLNSELRQQIPDLRITLTDYYPNIAAFKSTAAKADNIDFERQPVDALHVPGHLTGFRTQFLSFHHFRPDEARAILQNAVDAKSPIGIFETQGRSVVSIVAMLLSPISVLLTTPFIRPFKIGRIVFTYLIPMVPLCIMWDGVASSLRTYSLKEMNELVTGLQNKDDYQWTIGKEKNVLYLIGLPAKSPMF